MLFLDTCTVKASYLDDIIDSWVIGNASSSTTYNISLSPTDNTSHFDYLTSSWSGTQSGTNGSTSYSGSMSGTFVNSSVQGNRNYYTYHYKIGIPYYATPSSFDVSKLYGFIVYASVPVPSMGTISNFSVSYDNKPVVVSNTVSSNTPINYLKGYELTSGNGGTSDIGIIGTAEFDFTYSSDDYDLSDDDTISFSIRFDSTIWCFSVKDSVSSSVVEVYDSVTETQLEDLNSTQESIKDTAEDTNTKITDFFGSFFDNLLHIFVPEDGYFSEWFDKVNTLLSSKLGMLYAPFDLVISTLQAIYNADSSETGIPFPGIKWEDTWLVEPFTFTFASLGDSFDDLRDKVYFATDTVLVLTFLMLLQSKVKLILEGHE